MIRSCNADPSKGTVRHFANRTILSHANAFLIIGGLLWRASRPAKPKKV